MKKFDYSGVGVAMATPFKEDGEVDFAALERLVEHLIGGGIDYLVTLGTTAETPTLSREEKAEVLAAIKRINAGRLPIIVGIGGNSTAGVVADIGSTDLDGVEAILSVTPYYNKPSQRGLYEHYKAIAQASPKPIILYNVPSRTGINMAPETTLRLAREVPNIVAIKEANGDHHQLDTLLDGAPEGFRIISGEDATALYLVKKGGAGVISTAANAIPRVYAEMIKTGASSSIDAVNQFIADIFEQGSPAGIKAALHSLGLFENRLRLPLVPVTDNLYDRIARLARELQ